MLLILLTASFCSSKKSSNNGAAALLLLGGSSSSSSGGGYAPKGDVIDMSKAFNATLTANMIAKSSAAGAVAFSVQGNAANTWFKVPNGKLDVPLDSTLTFAINATSTPLTDRNFATGTGIIEIGTYVANTTASGKKANFDGTSGKEFGFKSLTSRAQVGRAGVTEAGIIALAVAVAEAKKLSGDAAKKAALNKIASVADAVKVASDADTAVDAITAVANEIEKALEAEKNKIATDATASANKGNSKTDASSGGSDQVTLCTPASSCTRAMLDGSKEVSLNDTSGSVDSGTATITIKGASFKEGLTADDFTIATVTRDEFFSVNAATSTASVFFKRLDNHKLEIGLTAVAAAKIAANKSFTVEIKKSAYKLLGIQLLLVRVQTLLLQ